MSIKSELTVLKTNIQNAKDKLCTNLTNKGVTTITTASTLNEMADSVNLITVGDTTTTIEKVIVNTHWLVTPEELKYDYEQSTPKHNWIYETDLKGDVVKQLIIPTGDYLFNNDWDVVYYDGSSWVQSKHTNGDDYYTRCTYISSDFYRMKTDSRYIIATDTWNDWTNEQNYYKPNEMPLNNIEIFYIYPEDKSYIYTISAATGNEFKFYEYNQWAYSYDELQFIHPSNGSEYCFYPVISKEPYYLSLKYSSESNNCEIVGGIIEFTSILNVDDDVLTLPAYGKVIKADYLLFNYGGFYDKFNFEFLSGGNNYDYPFDYHSKNINRLETVTFNNNITRIWYGFGDSYIDYVGELVFSNKIVETDNTWMGEWMEYCLIKNIGACESAYTLRFNSYNWGINEKYSNSRKSLTDSLITYSYDRTAAGYSTCTIALNSNVKGRLTVDEIAAITAKGFTIA